MSTVITRERLSFYVDKEYIEIEIPDVLRDAVGTILEFTEIYKTSKEIAFDSVLEKAFDSGEIELETLLILAKPWELDKKIVAGDIRSYEGAVYKATKEHTTSAVKGTLDETGFWIAYKTKIKEE